LVGWGSRGRTSARTGRCADAAPDGIVLVDTCPTKEVFESFAHGDDFRALRERHGFPEPSKLEDFPVHRAFIDGHETHL
jgi:hypothetical protein